MCVWEEWKYSATRMCVKDDYIKIWHPWEKYYHNIVHFCSVFLLLVNACVANSKWLVAHECKFAHMAAFNSTDRETGRVFPLLQWLKWHKSHLIYHKTTDNGSSSSCATRIAVQHKTIVKLLFDREVCWSWAITYAWYAAVTSIVQTNLNKHQLRQCNEACERKREAAENRRFSFYLVEWFFCRFFSSCVSIWVHKSNAYNVFRFADICYKLRSSRSF